MLEIILGGIILLLIVSIVLVYRKYANKECPVCNSPTCPGCPVYDLVGVCEIAQTKLADSLPVLTGLTSAEIDSSLDLQDTMYSFCDDAYTVKNLCPESFSQYEPTYTSLCSVASPPVLQGRKRYSVRFKDTVDGIPVVHDATAEQADAAVTVNNTVGSTDTVVVTDNVTGKPATADDIKNVINKGKQDRDNNKGKRDALCKIKTKLSSCSCVEGSTSGTRAWNTTYENKSGVCPITEDVQAKINCVQRPSVPCLCK